MTTTRDERKAQMKQDVPRVSTVTAGKANHVDMIAIVNGARSRQDVGLWCRSFIFHSYVQVLAMMRLKVFNKGELDLI